MNEPPRICLAQRPTPIQKLARVSARLGLDIWVWRDDLSGFAESGNKVRKLEFLLADALERQTTRLITCGGPQSNHARATAAVARRLGLDVTVVVREPPTARLESAIGGVFDRDAPASGNLLLCQILGVDFRFVSYDDYVSAGSSYDRFLCEEREASLARGERPYVIPEGGSCPLGCFGYMAAAQEFAQTWKKQGPGCERPDHLICALGSGGTLGGLVLGFEQLSWEVEAVVGVNVCDDEAYFQRRVGSLLEATCEAFDIPWSARPLNILDGYVGQGYGLASEEDFKTYMEIARLEGLLLDPVYTGKAFKALLREVAKDVTKFGKTICFLHSGGAFANFNYGEGFDRHLRVKDM